MKLDKRTQLAMIIALLAVAGVVAGLYFYDKSKRKRPDNPTTGGNASATPNTPTMPQIFPLKQGDKNDTVKALQRQMNAYYDYLYFTLIVKPPYKNLSVDGEFGSKTLANVKHLFGANEVSEAKYNKFMAWLPAGAQLKF